MPFIGNHKSLILYCSYHQTMYSPLCASVRVGICDCKVFSKHTDRLQDNLSKWHSNVVTHLFVVCHLAVHNVARIATSRHHVSDEFLINFSVIAICLLSNTDFSIMSTGQVVLFSLKCEHLCAQMRTKLWKKNIRISWATKLSAVSSIWQSDGLWLPAK